MDMRIRVLSKFITNSTKQDNDDKIFNKTRIRMAQNIPFSFKKQIEALIIFSIADQ